jgi:hypothetical protein
VGEREVPAPCGVKPCHLGTYGNGGGGRYVAKGDAGLIDRRVDNGRAKVGDYLSASADVLVDRATDHGWPRPTWTRESLSRTSARRTRARVADLTMLRVLRAIGALRGRPRSVVLCPLSARHRRRRLAATRHVVEHLAADEVLV